MADSKISLARGKGTPKPFARLIVADEFRVEQNGKMFVIGLYADGVVVVTIPKNAPAPSADNLFGLDALGLLVTIGGYEGETVASVSVGKTKVVEREVSFERGGSVNLHLALRPFRLSSFGVKDVIVEFAGTRHKLQFEIRAKYIDAVNDLTRYITEMPPAHAPLQAPEKKRKVPTSKLPKTRSKSRAS